MVLGGIITTRQMGGYDSVFYAIYNVYTNLEKYHKKDVFQTTI